MMVVGATSSELVLTQVTVEMNDTQYYCVATNNSGNVTSNTGYLTVDFDIGTYACIKLACAWLLKLLLSIASMYVCVYVCVYVLNLTFLQSYFMCCYITSTH